MPVSEHTLMSVTHEPLEKRLINLDTRNLNTLLGLLQEAARPKPWPTMDRDSLAAVKRELFRKIMALRKLNVDVLQKAVKAIGFDNLQVRDLDALSGMKAWKTLKPVVMAQVMASKHPNPKKLRHLWFLAMFVEKWLNSNVRLPTTLAPIIEKQVEEQEK
ncbi:hypothetical protein HDU96_006148 [Phlyctochytrium bullatum]|nr:hypothetical protein HDU96_006148 [Phlyctochytrium bullatum]